MSETPGQRVYKIRLALGDGVKNPMTLKDFAALITRATKTVIDPSALSRLENGGRGLSIDDAHAIAAIDPKRRGPVWLAFGDAQTPPIMEGVIATNHRSHPDPDAATAAVPRPRRGRAGGE